MKTNVRKALKHYLQENNGMKKLRFIRMIRTLFDGFIEENQLYEGQISSSLLKFRKELMIPVIQVTKELEKELD